MASVVIPASAPALACAATVPLAIWCTISSAELLAVRRAFHPDAPLGPDLALLTRGRATRVLLASRLCAPPALLAVPALRLAAGLALPVAAWANMAETTLALLILIAGCTAWLSLATGGGDGADKIALIASTATALIAGGRLADDGRLCLAGLAWGAGQVTIAYATSGWGKLARPFWRDGSALAAAMTSHRSGHALAAAIVRAPGAAVAISWTVMLVEALFPLALVAPPAVCVALLAAMALFHVATAVVMGLNTYPWAFVATYPCVLAANAAIAGAIG